MLNRVYSFLSLRTPSSRLAVFTGITVAVYLVPYTFLDHAKLSLYERFHVPSPSIGLTRAYWKLLHGDPVGAWHRNKLIFIVLIIIAAIVINDGITFLMRRTSAVKP